MIARKVTLALMIRFLQNGLGFLSLFFVAHYMGPEAVGIIAFAIAYVAMFASFSDLGFGSAHIKRISEGKDLGKCNGTYFTVKALLTAVMIMVILATILISKYIRNQAFISKEHEIVLYIILLATVVGNLSMPFIVTFGARKETAKQHIPLLIEKVTLVSIKVFVAIMGLGVVLLAGASLISAIIALLCFLYLFQGYPLKKPDKDLFKSYATFALPVMFIGFLSNIAQNTDKVMVQFFWSTADVGCYSAAQRISSILTYITSASVTLIFPTISSYYSKGDIEGIRHLSNKAERYLSMVFCPAIAFLVVFSQPLSHILLGPKFVSSAPILTILAFVALINGTTAPYAQQAGGTNRIILAAKLSSMVFIANILLNFVFIPLRLFGIDLLGMGGPGAALATLISITIGSVLFRFYAYKISASAPNPRVLYHLLASLGMGIFLYFISDSMPAISWYYLILFVVIGMSIYIGLLVIFHEVTQNDLSLFSDILNPIRMKEYTLSEMRSGYAKDKL